MKRLFPLITCFLVVAVSFSGLYLFGQDLAEEELRSVRLGTVEFVNYEGPYERIDTLDQILGIGRTLASRSISGKYRIRRLFDPEAELLSADILSLEAESQVDHIDNLRRIMASYLTEAYGYNFEDASILAEFASYYNAVHRGEMNYFQTNYQPMVPAALDPGKAGLATVYSEWPGNTQIVLPISAAILSGEGAIDTDALTDDQVIEELRQEEDKGIPERKEMTELKEEEIEEQERAIDEAKEELAEEEQRLEQAEDELAEQEQEIAAAERETAAMEPGEEREAREEELRQEREELQEEQQQVQEEREEADQRREEIARAEEQVQERVEEIREEREDIARDERDLITAREEEPAVLIPFLYREAGARMGRLVRSNSRNGTIVERSGINTIRSSDLVILGDSYLVIAGEASGNRAVRLVSIDPESLEMRTQGDTDVYEESFLLVDGRRIYATILQGGEYRLGRFGTDLKLQAASTLTVVPNTWITLREGAIYAQGEDNGLLVLDPNSLENRAE